MAHGDLHVTTISGSGRERQARLVRALYDAAKLGDAGGRVRLLETHISYVLLTGEYAYKIKKAISLPFLDFTTLERRHACCLEELRLNRRLAPVLYLDVVPIVGTFERPELGGEGGAIEYAVRMREFSQEALLSHMLADGTLRLGHIDALADIVARFHQSVDVAAADRPFGTAEEVRRVALENFSETRPLLASPDDLSDLDRLRGWTEKECAVRGETIDRRHAHGFVRECHGDLHLGNIALVDDRVTVFDCIEFNDELRWIDVMNEAAFAVMDLQDRGRFDLSFRFLNAYLEITGDYAGVALLRFFVAYRAMVRAKVTAIRMSQLRDDAAGSAAALDEYRGYVALATRTAGWTVPAIVLMHGLAGSGKTRSSQRLLESLGAIRVRSDVERKRLIGLAADARTGSSLAGGLYAPSATDRTYDSLASVTRAVVAAGHTAIADAAFLTRAQRHHFRALASELNVPYVIVDCEASDRTLRERIARRLAKGRDASEADAAVLDYQQSIREPIAADETTSVVRWNTELRDDQQDTAVAAVAERIGATVLSRPLH